MKSFVNKQLRQVLSLLMVVMSIGAFAEDKICTISWNAWDGKTESNSISFSLSFTVMENNILSNVLNNEYSKYTFENNWGFDGITTISNILNNNEDDYYMVAHYQNMNVLANCYYGEVCINKIYPTSLVWYMDTTAIMGLESDGYIP